METNKALKKDKPAVYKSLEEAVNVKNESARKVLASVDLEKLKLLLNTK